MPVKSRIVLGLNSGTSADGVDTVACEISGRGPAMRVRVIGHVSTPFSDALRMRILSAMAPTETRTEEICRLHSAVGHAFVQAAAKAVREWGLRRVDLIGSHGQTICHLPPRRDTDSGRTKQASRGERSHRRGHDADVGTMQIGDAAIISAALGAPVVSQFRQADMAVGGQGAPLVPWTDYVLFRDAGKDRMIQNIGGIANLTWLPAGGDESDVRAFDCGPGNMVMDALARRFSSGRRSCDRHGRMAARGDVNSSVLNDLLAHPYLRVKPPKSCGREEFGDAFTDRLLKRFAGLRLTPEDWLATATAFTARCIVSAYAMMPARATLKRSSTGPGTRRIDEVILCGGGANNRTLVEHLSRALSESLVRLPGADGGAQPVIRRMDEFGISAQAKECVSFAMLAAACVDRVPANLPQVTGATRRVVLGQVTDTGSFS